MIEFLAIGFIAVESRLTPCYALYLDVAIDSWGSVGFFAPSTFATFLDCRDRQEERDI